jgi:hypothetical protein
VRPADRSLGRRADLAVRDLRRPGPVPLNLMEWFEPAFNAVEFFMLGVVQIL